MIIKLKVIDKNSGNVLDMTKEEDYRLCVSEKGTLYVRSLKEKDKNGDLKELNVVFHMELEN